MEHQSDSALEEMASFFTARSQSYDEVHLSHIDGGIESKRVLADYLPAAQEKNALHVLDLGVGTGLEIQFILEKAPDAHITGIDFSDGMLARLHEKYHSCEQQITLVKGNFMQTDLGISQYDCVVSVMAMHHFTQEAKSTLYQRIHACLKPGGVYLESDYLAYSQEYEDERFRKYQAFIQEQGLNPDHAYHFDTPCTAENQVRLLHQAGFDAVTEEWRVNNTALLRAVKRK